MAICGHCGADDVVGVEAQLRIHGYDWDYSRARAIGTLGTVTQVAQQTAESDSYGEYGDESEIWVVIRVDALDRYFRKYGVSDSYGSESWNGVFEEVFPQERSVTIYERKSE